MGASDVDVIRRGHESARAGPWRGDRRVAYLLPLPECPAPSEGFVRWAMGHLAGRGFTRVVTNALSPAEQAGFLLAGFRVSERLHVLTHDLREVPAGDEHCLRPARPTDRPAVLEVDNLAFPPFWRLDEPGLDDTLGATSRARFRLAKGPEGVIGYAVTGRSRRLGFLQRLAVHPRHQGRGLGRALVVDGLRWLRRGRARQAVVNTPVGNQTALALYEGLGFRHQPGGLCVLAADLEP